MNKWILSGGLAAFLAAGLPWTASYGAPYAPGDPSFSEQWAFYNDGTFSIEEEKNRYAVYDDPFGQPWAPGDWHFEEPELLGMLVQVCLLYTSCSSRPSSRLPVSSLLTRSTPSDGAVIPGLAETTRESRP